MGCHLWGRTESDTTEATKQHIARKHLLLGVVFFVVVFVFSVVSSFSITYFLAGSCWEAVGPCTFIFIHWNDFFLNPLWC